MNSTTSSMKFSSFILHCAFLALPVLAQAQKMVETARNFAEDSVGRQREIDEIMSLLSYALVYGNWQGDDVPRDQRRGYNIGALLVSESNEPVRFELNFVTSTKNSTQHAEVRLITKYLSDRRQFDLKNYTIYTTLEPCAMCAGMMVMTSVKRVVYGQHDVDFSKAFERLAVDNRENGGLGPYPRSVSVASSSTTLCAQLDSGYTEFLRRDSEKILAKFLASDAAKEIYSAAYPLLAKFRVKYNGNAELLEAALKFYKDYYARKSK